MCRHDDAMRISDESLVRVDDVSSNGLVRLRITLIQDHEKQVESTHNRRRNRNIRLERLGTVVSPEYGVRCRQDRCASIECRLNPSLRD